MSSAVWGLGIAVFIAAVVEMVEALTIVLAMGMTRGWRSTMAGVVAALVALVVFTAVAGYALATWLPEAALQLMIGTLMLIFGLQWLRKAILRSSGRKALHDEDEEFAEQTGRRARRRHESRLGLDWFALRGLLQGRVPRGRRGRLHRDHLRPQRRQHAGGASAPRSWRRSWCWSLGASSARR